MEPIAEMLAACGTDRAVMPPTALYNEGWMLRLVLDWFSRQPAGGHPLAFLPGSRWFSEVLLASQFLARHRGDLLAESWTHADGAVGHFTVGGAGRGDLVLDRAAEQLVVAEAKMYSGLSAGVRRAPTFDQAARNVACIAEVLRRAGRQPGTVARLAFVVLAPAEQFSGRVFGDLLGKASIERAVRERADAFGAEKRGWLADWFTPTLERIEIHALAWEDVAEQIGTVDPSAGKSLAVFLSRCKQYNRPAKVPAA